MANETTLVTLVNISEFSDEELAAQLLFRGYSDTLLDFAVGSCIIFMLIGIPGNLITVISLARYSKVRNATAIFIINMSCSDFLFCCINLPLAISTFSTRRWYLGAFMCRFFPFARFALSGAAIFSVIAITINRYIMISHPRLYTKLYTSRNVGIQVACIWIGSTVSLIPTWIGEWGQFQLDPESSFCVIVPDVYGRSPMRTLFISAFVIPLLTISICYARIFYIVRQATTKSRGGVRRKVEKEDSSFETSTREKLSNGQTVRVQSHLEQPPEHPRVQSLRPPSTLQPKVSIAADDLSSAPSMTNFTRALNLRKSQLLNIAPTSKDKRLLTMITAIVITFLLLHLPITIIKVVAEHDPVLTIWSYVLRYLTTCINPIIYVVMSHEYRKAYKKVLLSSCKNTKNSPCLPR